MLTIRLLESENGVQFNSVEQFPEVFPLSESHKGLATYYPPNSVPSATTDGDSESFLK